MIKENNKIKESFCVDSHPMYGAISKDITDTNEMLKQIKIDIKEKTLADVILVIVYQMFMSIDSYNQIKSIFPNLTEEEIILQVYKQNLYKPDCIVIRGVYSIVYDERVGIKKLKS